MAKKPSYSLCPYCGKVVEETSKFAVISQRKVVEAYNSHAVHPRCFTRLIQEAKEEMRNAR